VVNKAAKSKSLDLAVEETALAGCTEFQAIAPATGTAPNIGGGRLHLEEPAESISVYEVQ
jgi:hypothetical protein